MATMHYNPSRRIRAAAAVLCLALVLPLLSGCQTVRYYSHAALGQFKVLRDRDPVPRVMSRLEARRGDDPDAALLYQRLQFSQRVLAFAERELDLEVGSRYRSYVDLDRQAAVSNVLAAPALSLEPNRWCYPVVGCAPYRGYFDEGFAQRQSARLSAEGYDIHVGPVAAYSTLGWFADPLMSSFITWPERSLAQLMFHELAHGQVWVPGDVAFNESFATFVGRQGLARWMAAEAAAEAEGDTAGGDTIVVVQRQGSGVWPRMLDLLARTRTALEEVYASALPVPLKLEEKARVIEAAQACYLAEREWLGEGRYDALMLGLNNARLASIAAYEDLVPGFAALFDSVDGRWPDFYAAVADLAGLDIDQRTAELRLSGQQRMAYAGDDEGGHQVQCQALRGGVVA